MSSTKLQSLLQNGLVHHRAGRLAEAEVLYRQARALAPRHFEALHLSGLLARQQQRIEEAIDLLGRALRLSPAAVACEVRLAGCLLAARRISEAERHARHALELKPDFPDAWEQLAACLKAQDRLPEAIACHEKVVALKPEAAAGWVNFGLTLRLVGRVLDALACHDRARSLDPEFAPARFGRAQALQQLHRTAEAVEEYDAFLRLQPNSTEARSNRLFALHNLAEISRESLFAEHVRYGQLLGSAAAPAAAPAADPERRLRVGIVSPDLRAHSCAYFLEPLLQHLDRDAFEVYLYHDHFREDATSARLRELASVWRNLAGQNTALVERQVRDDAIDVLIDLAGHTGMTNRLPVFARRPAPVQITYLGYPNTTGVAAIGYRFTDAIADPEGEADAFATETLVRFAPTAWSYLPSPEAPAVAPTPGLANGFVTFGCFNDLSKVTDPMLATWAELLARVPQSRLMLKARGLGEPAVREHFEGRLRTAGLDPASVDLLERTPDTASHLALYHRVDVALDTFPYHGTTTTCEALWMGVPVISLIGDRHVSRVGASLLAAAGHPDWAVTSRDAYVRAAAELATDLPALDRQRQRLRADLAAGPLLDHAAQGARFGEALRSCWRQWCAGAAGGAASEPNFHACSSR